jgi:hypothetical protein
MGHYKWRRNESLGKKVGKPLYAWIDYMPDDLDPSIRDLVFALNALGLPTMGSCEGYLDGHHHNYPWVTVYGLYKQKWLHEILREYNKTSGIKWDGTDAISLNPDRGAKNPMELLEMQSNAKKLAEFLVEHVEWEYVNGAFYAKGRLTQMDPSGTKSLS